MHASTYVYMYIPVHSCIRICARLHVSFNLQMRFAVGPALFISLSSATRHLHLHLRRTGYTSLGLEFKGLGFRRWHGDSSLASGLRV